MRSRFCGLPRYDAASRDEKRKSGELPWNVTSQARVRRMMPEFWMAWDATPIPRWSFHSSYKLGSGPFCWSSCVTGRPEVSMPEPSILCLGPCWVSASTSAISALRHHVIDKFCSCVTPENSRSSRTSSDSCLPSSPRWILRWNFQTIPLLVLSYVVSPNPDRSMVGEEVFSGCLLISGR